MKATSLSKRAGQGSASHAAARGSDRPDIEAASEEPHHG